VAGCGSDLRRRVKKENLMHVHFVVHESYEDPAGFETWVRERGFTAGFSRVYRHEPLPQTADGIDLLVVMGGPQSPATTRQECPHFDTAAEQALIAKCVTANKAVIGVCLGSQLLGEALGARFEHSPEMEIGKFPITLTPKGRANDKFAHFGETLEVCHWHSDMPGLTKDATIIAYSEGCPRQIVEYSRLVYGFQCHMEFNRKAVELLIAECDLPELSKHRFVQQPDAMRANDYSVMNENLFLFLDKLVSEYRKLGAMMEQA
jgi:GMP synthase (glutamine-hydrolysing)